MPQLKAHQPSGSTGQPTVKIPTIREFYAGDDFGEPQPEEKHDFLTRRLKAALEGQGRGALPLPAQVDFERIMRLADGRKVQAFGSTIQWAMDAVYRLERALYRCYSALAVQEVIAFWRCEQIRPYILTRIDRIGIGVNRSGCLDYVLTLIDVYLEQLEVLDAESKPAGPESGLLATGTNSNSAGRHEVVDSFLLQCNQEPNLKVIRKHIWLAVCHQTPRQFQYWQASDPKATAEDDRNFRRILAMIPDQFRTLLKKKGII